MSEDCGCVQIHVTHVMNNNDGTPIPAQAALSLSRLGQAEIDSEAVAACVLNIVCHVTRSVQRQPDGVGDAQHRRATAIARRKATLVGRGALAEAMAQYVSETSVEISRTTSVPKRVVHSPPYVAEPLQSKLPHTPEHTPSMA